MKAKVLILPDARASFVSYMKRQTALRRFNKPITTYEFSLKVSAEKNSTTDDPQEISNSAEQINVNEASLQPKSNRQVDL